MKEHEVKAEAKKARDIPAKYMMATKAYHQLGDISRDKADLCSVSQETDDYYVGAWIAGYGFINVLFPKETTRELTEKEIEYWNGRYVQIASHPPQKLKVD